jgi:hypothetical protein
VTLSRLPPAFDAISLFCQMKKADQGETYILKNNEGNISAKKTELKTKNADWSPV